MAKKRYLELDRQNVLFCLIVVFIHAFGVLAARLNPSGYPYIVSAAVLKNCAFVVQGFMFLSAVKYTQIYKDRKLHYGKFLFSRIKKVIIPYVLCTFVYYAVFIYRGVLEAFNIRELGGYILRGDLSAQFYFVIAIVQFYVLMPLWIFLAKKVSGWIITALGLAAYGLWIYFAFGYTVYYDRIFLSYIPFWLFGVAAGKNYDSFRKVISANIGKIGILYVILFCANGFLGQVFVIHPCILEVLHTAYSFAAILLSYGLFVDDGVGQNVLTSGINRLSYEIYLWHCLVLSFIDVLINKMELPRISHQALVRVGGIYLVIFAASLVMGLLLKIKNKKRKR